MDDEMADGVNTDISAEGGLGFKPQRRNLSNNLLPYSSQLDSEIASQLKIIKTNLLKCSAEYNMQNGILFWINKLLRFIKLYSYCFSKADHVSFVKLIFELLITPREDFWITLRMANTLLTLLKKMSLLTPDDLQLPWRPLYELHKKYFYCSTAYQNMHRLPQHAESVINSVIRYSRGYFAPGTTEELLEEFVPKMCPFDEQMHRTIKYLDMFLPILRRQGLRPPNHHLWRPFILDMIRNSPYWEPTAFGLMSRLAWKNIGTVDWENELPLFFTKILRSMNLPVGYKGVVTYSHKNFENMYIAMFVIANLGGGSSCQLHLTRMIGVLESYLHPSNAGYWTSEIMDLVNKLTLYFNRRINRERHSNDTESWEFNIIPSEKRLTDTDIDQFVQCLLPVMLTALFGRSGFNEAAMVISRLATHRTALVMEKFLDLLYPALTSNCEPARLHACLQAAVLTARPLVTGGVDFPSGPTHVLPILKLLLPGIDPNDISKTMSAFQLITSYTTLIPLVDCSTAPQHVALTEVEIELCEQSAELCDFLLVFLERCLSIVESCVSAHSALQYGAVAGPGLSGEESLLEAAMAFTIRSIFQQAHPDISKVLVRHLASRVIGRTLETGVSGRLMANVCRSVAKAQPNLTLSALVPPLCRLLLSLTAAEAAQKEERPDAEIMFNLLILAEVMTCRGNVVVQHVPTIVPVLRQCLHLTCVPAQQLAVSLLGNALSALSVACTTDYRSVTFDWDAPYSEVVPVRHWGALLPGGWRQMKVQWFEPGTEECEAVSHLLHSFLVPELDRLDLASKDLSVLTKDELQQSLHIVNHCLNAAPLLPPWDELPFSLPDTPLPYICLPLVLSSKPQEIKLKVEGRPNNVRRAIALTILGLADSMIAADSDNTKAYSSIVNILWSLLMLHSVKRNDYDGRWRTLNQVQRLLKNNLVEPHQRWYHVRHVMVQRAHLQHLSRTLEHVEEFPFTNLHKEILHMALRLSTTNYSQVRQGGQHLLRNILAQFPSSSSILVPELRKNLTMDPVIHHKAFKGTLHVLLGFRGAHSIIVRRDWHTMKELWPALLAAKHSEKPSITALITQAIDQVLKLSETVAISQLFPESLECVVANCAEVSGVTLDSDVFEAARLRLKKEALANMQLYKQIITDVSQQLGSQKLHWRFVQMGVSMLGALIRINVPFPAEAVRAMMDALLHPNVHVRRLVLYFSSTIFRNQKRPHKKYLVDPLSLRPGSITKVLCEDADCVMSSEQISLVRGVHGVPNYGSGEDARSWSIQEVVKPSVARHDNKWLQYNKDVIVTEELFNARRFVHLTYLGFTCWPKSIPLYAPHEQQPKLNRSLGELSEAECEVFLFFINDKKLSKLIEFLSLENQRGTVERFDLRRMMLWKGLFRNFGAVLLPHIRPHLERLVNDPTEASQRCAAELVAGMMRATKHWSYTHWREATTLALTCLQAALSKMSVEALENWHRAVCKISMDRDPHFFADFIEMFLDIPDLPNTSSFSLQCRLYICSGLLWQQEWRIMTVLQRVLNKLRTALSHPYKNVRDRISNLLLYVFSQSTGLIYDGPVGVAMDPTDCPDLSKFIDYVLEELGSLHEYSGGGNSSDKMLLTAPAVCSSSPSAPGVNSKLVVSVAAVAALPPRRPTHMDDMVTADELSPTPRQSTGRDTPAAASEGSEERHYKASTMEDEDPNAAEDEEMDSDHQHIVDTLQESVMYSEQEHNAGGGEATVESSTVECEDRETAASRDSLHLPSPSFDSSAGETDERKTAFRIVNTMCTFIDAISFKHYYSVPRPLYSMLGALCQLESVDSEQEVCSKCMSALCIIGQSLVHDDDIMPLLERLRDIALFKWWRARSAALGVLQMLVFHNALTVRACDGAPSLILYIVLDKLVDERLEVRNMASQVLASLLHISFVPDKDNIRMKFIRTLRKCSRVSPRGDWSSERVVKVHGAVLGLTAFVGSAPYTVPSYLPQVLCTLADYINLPQPISGSIRDSLSNFKRTHHDNWQEHKQHFSSDQLDTLNDLLLSPSYYA